MLLRATLFLILLAVPVHAAEQNPLRLFFDMMERGPITAPSALCRVTGKTRGLHPRLKTRLCAMSRKIGPVQVISGCRAHGSRRAPKSYHRRAVGCKAADVVVKGASRRQVLRYWKRTGGGGRGFYRNRRFVHVDIGPDRTWNW